MLTIAWSTDTSTLDPDSGEITEATAEHVLAFDAVVQEIHNATATVTEHTVEEGSPLADHKKADPETLTLEAWVSNTPIGDVPPSGYTSGTPPTASVEAADVGSVLQFDREFNRVQDALGTLRRLVQEPTLVTIATGVRTYENMTLISVSAPRDHMDGIKFSIEIKQVRIARTQLVDAPEPREPRGGRNQNAGTQEGSDPEDGEGGVAQSILSQGREAYEEARENGEGVLEALGTAAGAAVGF